MTDANDIGGYAHRLATGIGLTQNDIRRRVDWMLKRDDWRLWDEHPEVRLAYKARLVELERERERTKLDAQLATIPQRYRWASWDASDLRNRVTPPEAVDALVDIDPVDARVITLVGTAGRGKTSLACCMLRALILSGSSGLFARAVDVARARAGTKLGKEPPLMAQARACDMLVLDDLGLEPDGEGRIDVRDIIHSRHEREAPLLVTTGLTIEEAKRIYGASVYRRLFGDDSLVVNLG